MKLKCISCDSIARAVYHCAARSPHIVDVELLRLGLHLRPENLRERIQEKIDRTSEQSEIPFDAIVLGYGLCGQATSGLAARDIPLVIPRAHDCITFFLGSRAAYRQQHEECPGTIWHTKDYMERTRGDREMVPLGADMAVDLPSVYEKYVKKYGKNNADYLMEVMGEWQKHYERAVFVDQGIVDATAEETSVKADAERKGWRFEKMAGDLVLVRRLLFGEWDDTDFLTVEPGEKMTIAFGDEVMTKVASSQQKTGLSDW